MSGYVVSPLALADLDEIWNYIGVANGNPNAAAAVIERLREAFQLLSTQPFMGQLRSELSPGVRSLSVGNYVVYYRPADSQIMIISVLHGARDVETVFLERDL